MCTIETRSQLHWAIFFRRLNTLFSDFLRRITLAIGKEQAYQHAQCENSCCQSRHEDLTTCKKRILVPWQSLQGQSFKQPTGTTSTPSFRWKAYFSVPVSTMRKDGTFILVTSIPHPCLPASWQEVCLRSWVCNLLVFPYPCHL